MLLDYSGALVKVLLLSSVLALTGCSMFTTVNERSERLIEGGLTVASNRLHDDLTDLCGMRYPMRVYLEQFATNWDALGRLCGWPEQVTNMVRDMTAKAKPIP